MRIGIDIKCLRSNKGGVGRYTRNLMDALQKIDTSNEYVLFSPSPIKYSLCNPKWRIEILPTKLPGILWQQQVLPAALKKENIQLIWGPEQTIPLFGIKKISSILTVHDFVYRRYPSTMQKTVLWINKSIGSKSIKKASAIVTVSDFTRQELFHFFPKIDKTKVDVVNCAIKADLSVFTKTFQSQSYKKQLLFVGSLEPRKNLTGLIKALEILKNKGIDIPLVITGPKGWKNKSFKNLMNKSQIAPHINHKGYVSDKELKDLYQESAAVIFPSFYEGFGLPALEAISHGTPILTSKGTVMESILGNCGLYFDPTSSESIAQTIETLWNHVINNGQTKSDLWECPQLKILELKKLLEKYTWENSAKKLLEVFNKVKHD